VSSEILVDFHAPRLSVEVEDLGRRTCCGRVRQIYPWGYNLGGSTEIWVGDNQGIIKMSCYKNIWFVLDLSGKFGPIFHGSVKE
jgi:hypothetical protein